MFNASDFTTQYKVLLKILHVVARQKLPEKEAPYKIDNISLKDGKVYFTIRENTCCSPDIYVAAIWLADINDFEKLKKKPFISLIKKKR